MYNDKMADEIMAYLRENPYAGDSVEGISRWWLMRQQVSESIKAVQEVLEHLRNTGFLCERRLASGRKVYFAAQPETTVLTETENSFEGGLIQ